MTPTAPAPNPPQIQALLDQLEPVVSPPPVGLWPLAPGWWILMALALAAITAAVLLGYSWYKKNGYKREALRLILALTPEPTNVFAANINAILKRTALSAYAHAHATISQTFGAQWVEFLNNTTKAPKFNDDAMQALSTGMYQKSPTFDANALKAMAIAWVKTHKKPGKDPIFPPSQLAANTEGTHV